MIKKKIIISGEDFCGVKYAPKHELYFIMKKTSVDVYSALTFEKKGSLSSETVTDICFNDAENRIYCVNIAGGISMYDMDNVLNGNVEPMKKVPDTYKERMELITNIHWIRDDIVLVPGDPDIYVIDVYNGVSEKIYDYNDNSIGVAAYNSYYDEKKKILHMVSDKSQDSSITLKGQDIDVAIPAEVIFVDCKSVETIYAGDFRLIVDNKRMALFDKSVDFALVGKGVEGSGEFTDKKFSKKLEQIGINHIKYNEYGLTVMDVYDYILIIDTSSGTPYIDYIKTNSYGFELLEGNVVLVCMENEGLVTLSV